jgi:hypothetical protein
LVDEVINILWNSVLTCTGMPFVPLLLCLPLVYQSKIKPDKRTLYDLRKIHWPTREFHVEFRSLEKSISCAAGVLYQFISVVKFNVEFPGLPMNVPIKLYDSISNGFLVIY